MATGPEEATGATMAAVRSDQRARSAAPWLRGRRQSESTRASAPRGLNQESPDHEHVYENPDFRCRHRYRTGDYLSHPSGHDRCWKATHHGTSVACRACPWPEVRASADILIRGESDLPIRILGDVAGWEAASRPVTPVGGSRQAQERP